ncbi:isochorismatase family protein [Nocardioides humi]|uniref:isochorismatase family protein n=1 Tax=Nocardioides humi TaxID=449461 RepID=UPI003CCC5F61
MPEHTDILDAVAPEAGERVLVKHRYSAFARSELAEELAAAGRDQLVITGVYAHIGVTATALEAFQREVHPFVVADAVADFGPEEHALALRQIASCCGVVATADSVVAALTPAAPAAAGAGAGLDAVLRDELAVHLDADLVATAFADPETDLFSLGLDSLRAFEVLDVLAESGVDVDFGEFTRRPTISFLRERALVVGV